MRKSSAASILALLLIFTVLNICPSAQASSQSKQKWGWLIRRTNDRGIPYTTYYYPEIARFMVKGYIIDVARPFKNCVVYHEANKRYLDIPFEKGGELLAKDHHKLVKDLKFDMEKIKPKTIAGYKAEGFRINELLKDGTVYKTKRVWYTKALGLPQKEIDTWAKLFSMPEGQGFCVRMIKETMRGHDKVDILEMDTLEIKHVAWDPVAMRSFRDFKRVKNEMDLVIDTTDKDTMDLFSEPQK